MMISAKNLDPHVYTALPIAAARAVENQKTNTLIQDSLAKRLLLGENHLMESAAVGYMTLRALIGDELCREGYYDSIRQVRQFVSLGAGMDTRAFRLNGMNEGVFYEVDKQDLFTVKEPIVKGEKLEMKRREIVVGTLGSLDFDLNKGLLEKGFNPSQPTVWLLEGLVPYLSVQQLHSVAKEIGSISAVGSSLWMDSFSKTSVNRPGGMVFHGVPFASGCDDYDEIFRIHGGFDQSDAYDMDGVGISKNTSGETEYEAEVVIDSRYRITKEISEGKGMCVMVKCYKTKQVIKGRISL